MVYQYIENPEATKKLIHYLDVWKLKCNPFWLDALCGFDASKQMEFEHGRIIRMFIEAFANTRIVFYMKEEDLRRGMLERGWDFGLVTKAIKDGVLVDKSGYIGLSDKILDVLY